MPLTLTFDVEPDEHGIIDGREMAEQLIAFAFLAVVPYVDGCPVSADRLFSVIANRVMHALHEEGRATGQLDATAWRPGHSYDEAAFTAHYAAAQADTLAMLRGNEAERDQ